MNAEELRELNKKRKITQLCFATTDYKKTIKYLTEHFQWGPWSVGIDSEKSSDPCYVYGKLLKKWKYYFAVTMIGDLEIEVIQPIDGPAHFDTFLKEKGEGLHHFKESIPGKEEMFSRAKMFQDSGVKNCFECGYNGESYLFLDSYNVIGAYYEISDRFNGNGDLDDMEGFVEQYPKD